MNEEQLENVLAAFEVRRGNRPILKEDVDVLREWVNDSIINYGILENVLSSRLSIDVTDGEVAFSMTTEGAAEAKKLCDSDSGKAFTAELDANKEKIAPHESWPRNQSLAGRVLKLLYFWDHAEHGNPNAALIGSVIGCSESAAALALKALEDHKMIDAT